MLAALLPLAAHAWTVLRAVAADQGRRRVAVAADRSPAHPPPPASPTRRGVDIADVAELLA